MLPLGSDRDPVGASAFLSVFYTKERSFMNDSILLYERYLLDVKHSAANTVASYIRDIKQYTSYVDDMLQCPLELVTPDQAAVYFACTIWNFPHNK